MQQVLTTNAIKEHLSPAKRDLLGGLLVPGRLCWFRNRNRNGEGLGRSLHPSEKEKKSIIITKIFCTSCFINSKKNLM